MDVSNFKFSDQEIELLNHYRDNQDDARLQARFIALLMLANREQLMAALKEKDIHCGIHYPIPVHLQPAYDKLGLQSGSYPVAERLAREFLSLPIFAEIKSIHIQILIEELKRALFSIPTDKQ